MLSLRPDIISCFDKSDIFCIQESWLSQQDLACINNLHSDFLGIGVATTDLRDGLLVGHPPGGVCVFYRKTLQQDVKILDFGLSWCTGIELSIGNNHLAILTIYLPYQCIENEDDYQDCLGELGAVLEELCTSSYIIVGDWNADVSKANTSRFQKYMLQFCTDHDLFISTQLHLPSDSFTYVSESWGSVSWLDHAVTSADCHSSIHSASILYDVSQGDHIPFLVQIEEDCIPKVSHTSETNQDMRIDWGSLPDAACLEYHNVTEELLQSIEIPDSIYCRNVQCDIDQHADQVFAMYQECLSVLLTAGEQVSRKFSCPDGSFNRPGWNDYVADLYQASRDQYLRWLQAGRPRDGPVAELHFEAKARFKYALRYIKRHENQLRREALARKVVETSSRNFWKDVKKSLGSRCPLPTEIEGASGEVEIAELWKSHFESLFNSINDVPAEMSEDIEGHDDVSVDDIESAIKELQLNKACGPDLIFAEHLRYSSKRVLEHLSMCFSFFLSHGVLPKMMLSVTLVPVVKNKAGKISAKDNYRPIALASVVSKLFERILLDRLNSYLTTEDNQFGFKKLHGTDQCIFVLKELAESYREMNGNVYMGFLDASKAFDRVNHRILFQKLAQRNVPAYLRRVLQFWYARQQFSVRWGCVTSASFSVSNGVRQGGILSPVLFNIYMNDLSVMLNAHRSGCYIGDMKVNHLMYADDVVVLAPTAWALQALLNVCTDFGDSNDVRYNAAKSVVMVCRSRLLKDVVTPDFLLNGAKLKEVSSVKYLGHMISDDLTDDEDIVKATRQLYCQGNVLLRFFHMCNIEVKLRLFRTYCYQLYCMQLWRHYRAKSMQTLKIAYHNILKKFVGLSKFSSTSCTCVTFNIKSFGELMRGTVYTFECRLGRSQNNIVSAIQLSSLRYTSQLRKKWLYDLYTFVPG